MFKEESLERVDFQMPAKKIYPNRQKRPAILEIKILGTDELLCEHATQTGLVFYMDIGHFVDFRLGFRS